MSNYSNGKLIAMAGLVMQIIRMILVEFLSIIRFYRFAEFLSADSITTFILIFIMFGFLFMFFDRKNPLDLMMIITLCISIVCLYLSEHILDATDYSSFVIICLNILSNSYVAVLALRAFSHGNNTFFALLAFAFIYVVFSSFIWQRILSLRLFHISLFMIIMRFAIIGVSAIVNAVAPLYLMMGDEEQ